MAIVQCTVTELEGLKEKKLSSRRENSGTLMRVSQVGDGSYNLQEAKGVELFTSTVSIGKRAASTTLAAQHVYVVHCAATLGPSHWLFAGCTKEGTGRLEQELALAPSSCLSSRSYD